MVQQQKQDGADKHMTGRKRASRSQQSSPQPKKEVNPRIWFTRSRAWITAALALFGWLLLNTPEVLQNLRGLPDEAEKTLAQYQAWLHEDSEWTGRWTAAPEGIVDSADLNLSGGDVEVTIWSTGGEIDGTIATNRICDSVPLDFILLRGKVSGDSARVFAWDIVGGRKLAFGELDLTRDGDILTMHLRDGMTGWFPQSARMTRDPSSQGIETKPDTTFCDAR